MTPALVGALFTSIAQGGVILQPTGAVTTSIDGGTTPAMGSLDGFGPERAIDQSGLLDGYITGVTDFDAYMATNPVHQSNISNFYWLSQPGNPTVGFFDFDLGGYYTIEAMALWNFGEDGGQNVQVFDLVVADNPDFTGGTSFLVDPVDVNTGPSDAVLPQVFEITPTGGRYVRMEILANNGNPDFVSFGEAAFEVTVPEPGSVSLVALAATGLLLRRRRRI